MMWLTVLVVAIAIAIMMSVQEIPVRLIDANNSISNEETVANVYNIFELTAPAMAGPLLTIFSQLACHTLLRPFIVRFLLNKNGVADIRQLLITNKLVTLPPTYYPITRLATDEEYNYHVQAAEATNVEDIIRTTGLPSTKSSCSSGSNTTETTANRYRSVMDYHHVYQSGKATPTMVLTKLIHVIETRLEPQLHIFSSFLNQDVLKQARASDERWKSGTTLSILDGVPIAVKDMVHVTNHKLCYGSQICIPASDNNEEDAMVANFRDLGAIILGVTVSTEGGVTPLGYNLWWDGPFNPFDVNYYPGGSSSGSGVAVATGLTPIALGFDGGGSIRVPASMVGVVGLAATCGRIPTAAALEVTVVKAGPLTGTVSDAALAHLVMSKEDPRRPVSFYSKLYDGGIKGVPPAHLDGYLKPSSNKGKSNNDIKGMRMGIFWEHFTHSDPEVVEACVETIRFLETQGAILVNITIPHLREVHLSHGLKILSEFSIAWESVFDDTTGTMPQLEANTEITIIMGKQLTATEVLAAEKIRTLAMQHIQEHIFRDLQIDAIVSPTLGSKVPKPARGYRSTGESNTPLVYKVMRFMPLANFLGLPAMSVPVGYEKDTGLPIGFQLLGEAWMEHKLLRIAAVIESDFVERRTPPKGNYYDALAEWLS